MKRFLQKLLTAVFVFAAVLGGTTAVTTEPTYAWGEGDSMGSCRDFLGMKSWDCGMVEISSGDSDGQEKIMANVWIIATNVLNDMLVLSTYLALGFIVYGGYLYIFASGDVAKTQNGRKTLTRASIGLAIVMLSKVIVNSMHIAFLGNAGAFSGDCVMSDSCITADALVTNTLQWFIGIAGVIAFIFVVIGGISYMTSSGDAGKLQKAKNTIIYAVVGLIIVALAEIILGAVSGAIRESGGDTGTPNQVSVASAGSYDAREVLG